MKQWLKEKNKTEGSLAQLVFFSFLAIVLMVGVVYGATLDYPASSSTLSDNVTANVTVTPGDNYLNATATFACTSPSAGGSTTLGTQNNQSASTSSFNVSMTTKNVGDCIGTLTLTMKNDTSSADQTATATGVIIDNYVTTVSFASTSLASTTDTSVSTGSFDITTSEGVTGANLIYCGQNYALTGSNDTWSYSFNEGAKTLAEGVCQNYYISVTGTGASDSTSSDNRNLWVHYGLGSSGSVLIQEVVAQEEEDAKSKQNTAIIIVIISLVAYLTFFKGRK